MRLPSFPPILYHREQFAYYHCPASQCQLLCLATHPPLYTGAQYPPLHRCPHYPPLPCPRDGAVRAAAGASPCSKYCDVSHVTCHVSPHVHQQTALQLEHFCTVFAHVASVAVRGGEVLAQLLVGVGSGGRALVLAVELGHLQIKTKYF